MPRKLVIADLSCADSIERKQMCNVRGGMIVHPTPLPEFPPGLADYLVNVKNWLGDRPTYPSGGGLDPGSSPPVHFQNA